jgi:hypothetical protein
LQFARKTPVRDRRNGEVYSMQVHPRVWQTAVDLADGDWRRIEIVSETEVVVCNSRR